MSSSSVLPSASAGEKPLAEVRPVWGGGSGGRALSLALALALSLALGLALSLALGLALSLALALALSLALQLSLAVPASGSHDLLMRLALELARRHAARHDEA